jgi:hypothetical protein
MRFTADRDAVGLVLKPTEAFECDSSTGILQTLPEWKYVLNDNGEKIGCNISNLLEVRSLKADNDGKKFQDVYCLMTLNGSFLYYKTAVSNFYAVITNCGQVDPILSKTRDGTRFILCSGKGVSLGTLGGTVQTFTMDGVLGIGALFKHRLFLGMKGGKVKYSAPEDFTNFTNSSDDGGQITFPNYGGEIIAMKPYDDALYIFFRSGIMRLDGRGEPSSFYAERLDYTGGDIFERTICVCQHAVYFLARNGLYRLKGKKTERLDLSVQFPSEATGKEGCAVWKDSPIFRYQTADGSFKTIVVAKDGKSACFMRDLNLLGKGEDGKVLFVDAAKYLCELTEQGEYYGEGRFFAQETDFGSPQKKRLERLRFYGEGSFNLVVFWENGSLQKRVEFKNGYATVEIPRAEYGVWFQFGFELGRATKITSVKAEYKTMA